jgi:hypothetical protein
MAGALVLLLAVGGVILVSSGGGGDSSSASLEGNKAGTVATAVDQPTTTTPASSTTIASLEDPALNFEYGCDQIAVTIEEVRTAVDHFQSANNREFDTQTDLKTLRPDSAKLPNLGGGGAGETSALSQAAAGIDTYMRIFFR